MAITNLNNDHFDPSQMEMTTTQLNNVLQYLNTKTRNLTPSERQQWGSIKEQNKLVPLKVLELADASPNLRSPNINYEELRADWTDRMFLANVIATCENIIRISDNVRITHDWDAYQASRQDYRHAEYMTETDGGAAYENKYRALKEFFTTNPGGKPETEEGETDVQPAVTK